MRTTPKEIHSIITDEEEVRRELEKLNLLERFSALGRLMRDLHQTRVKWLMKTAEVEADGSKTAYFFEGFREWPRPEDNKIQLVIVREIEGVGRDTYEYVDAQFTIMHAMFETMVDVTP